MPNRKYEQGVRFERELMHDYTAQGAHVIRASGSHGHFDLTVIFPGEHVILVQCKVTKSLAVASRLLRDFEANPPLKRGHYIQVLAVKIPRKGIQTAIVSRLGL